LGGELAAILTSGTGVYQGVLGHARCQLTTASQVDDPATPDPRASVVGEGDCITTITPGGVAPADLDPVILELGAGVTKMTVFTSPLDLPKKAYFNVLYFNPHDQAQTGLSLTLRAPEGTEMRAAARDEEETSAGERVWALPDLAPGALGSLEFSVTFLSADTATADLVAEIDGDGFDRPVRADPLEVEIAQ
jgi:hypothetical protein